MVERRTNKSMATRSSTIRMPNTRLANFLVFAPTSSKARMIIVVEDMERIAPRKMQSMKDHPNS
jgi:hypothetical protein